MTMLELFALEDIRLRLQQASNRIGALPCCKETLTIAAKLDEVLKLTNETIYDEAEKQMYAEEDRRSER